METLLVVNAGSSSLKFQVFGISRGTDLARVIKGQIDGIGTHPRFKAMGADGSSLIDQSFAPGAVPDLPAAVREAGAWLSGTQKLNLVAIGHRVVHGGPEYDRPALVDHEMIARLERYIPLAPLHQPNNLAPIRALLMLRPDLPQVACFDTAFHRSHSAIADHYALPECFYAEGVRRYGFHGLSYEYIAEHLRQVAPHVGASSNRAPIRWLNLRSSTSPIMSA
jgi:acetate kinase